VDFVVRAGRRTWALEIKSGLPRKSAGLRPFCGRFDEALPLLIGSGGMELEQFFLEDPVALLS
jgi:hypothetical protein